MTCLLWFIAGGAVVWYFRDYVEKVLRWLRAQFK